MKEVEERRDDSFKNNICIRRKGGIALRGRSREKHCTDVGTTLVRRFYSDAFRVNFRGLVVFVVEFASSFCCAPDSPHRYFVFAFGHVVPYFCWNLQISFFF